MTVAAKYAPVVGSVAAIGATDHSDLIIKVAAVGGGLALGAMWRAGSMRAEGAAWGAVRSDLAISALIGGANAVLALALIQWSGMGVTAAMAIGVLVGATGLRALPEIKNLLYSAARHKLLGDNVALIQPNDPALNARVDELRAAQPDPEPRND